MFTVSSTAAVQENQSGICQNARIFIIRLQIVISMINRRDNSCTKNIVLEVLELESFPVGVRS